MYINVKTSNFVMLMIFDRNILICLGIHAYICVCADTFINAMYRRHVFSKEILMFSSRVLQKSPFKGTSNFSMSFSNYCRVRPREKVLQKFSEVTEFLKNASAGI